MLSSSDASAITLASLILMLMPSRQARRHYDIADFFLSLIFRFFFDVTRFAASLFSLSMLR